ncbi:MAG: lysylphosphatidylglycerol synthase transmembrane domain-containing protein [Thermoplasmata archaeon]
MKKEVWEFFGLMAIGIGTVIAVFSIVGFDQIFESVSDLNPYYYAVVVAIIILSILLWAIRWGIFVKKNHPEVTWIDLFKMQLVGQAMNNITPVVKMGGEAGKLYLMKRKYEIEVREGLASISLDLILEFIVDIVLVLGAVSLLMILTNPPTWIFMILLGFAGICGLIFFLIIEVYFDMKIIHNLLGFLCRHIKRLNKYEDDIFERYESFRENFRELMSDRKRFAQGLGLSVGRKALTIGKFYILLAAFGFNIGLANIIIAMGLGIMLLMIPATPGNLGIYEGGMVSVFIFVGVSPGAAATAIFLDRLVWFWGVSAAGGIIGSKYGLEMISEHAAQKF